MNNCEHIEAQLVDLLDGALEDSARRTVEAHLEDCGACSETLRSYRSITAAYRELPEANVSEETARVILDRAHETPTRPRLLRPVALLVAAAALLLFVWGIDWLRGLDADPSETPVAELIERGDAFGQAGEVERAETTYELAAERAASPELAAAARHRLAALYLDHQRAKDAVALFDELVANYPDYSERGHALFERVRALASLGETGRAIQAYRLAAAEFPEGTQAFESEVQLLQAGGREPEELESEALNALGYAGD